MTNTHRKTTTNRTTAKIAAVGAFGIGAAIALPGIASAQEPAPETNGSLETIANAIPSESGLGTDLEADLGSLTFALNLDAGAEAPGSVNLGSVGVSPNTGSDLVDGGSGEATGSLPGSSEDDAPADDETSGSLDMGSLGGGTGSLPGSSEEPTEDPDAPADDTGSLDMGSVTDLIPGSSEEPTEDPDAPADDAGSLDMGSVTDMLPGSSDDEAAPADPEASADDTGSLDFGSLTEQLAGLSSEAEAPAA